MYQEHLIYRIPLQHRIIIEKVIPLTNNVSDFVQINNQKKKLINYYCYTDENGSFLDITFDDLDLDYFDDNPRKSTVSSTYKVPEMARPHSAMSYSSTTTANTSAMNNNSNRKSTFHLFKNNRNSFSGDVLPRASSPASVYDPDAPNNTMNFDDLIKSGGTVKVSLTPNRLRSIEHKDELAPPQPTWERRSTSSSSPRLSAVNAVPSRPSSPLVTNQNQNAAKKLPQPTSLSSSSGSSSSSLNGNNDQDAIQVDYHKPKMSIEVPKINARPQTPSSPLSKKSFIVNDASRFENPRNAPKPPPSLSSDSLPATIPIASPLIHPPSSIKSPTLSTATIPNNKPPSNINSNTTKSPVMSSPPTPKPTVITPLGKLSPTSPKIAPSIKSTNVNASTTSVNNNSNDSIASTISSVASMPSPIVKSTTSTTISNQEPPLPRPTKSNNNNNNNNNTNTTTTTTTTTPNKMNTNGMVIRRSSMSSRKSRENLRKLKEEQLQKELAAVVVDEPLPTSVLKSDDVINTSTVQVLTDEPQEIGSNSDGDISPSAAVRQVRFDSKKTADTNTNEQEASLINDPIVPNIAPNVLDGSSPPPTSELPPTPNSNGVIPRKKAPTLSPERPSSMVAKRASMVSSNRRRSMHEDVLLRQRVSTVGSVSVSIKQWDDILKSEEPTTTTNSNGVIPPAAHRRSVLRQLRQQQQQQVDKQDQDGTSPAGANNNAVLDKVLKFERASTLDDHQRVSHMPRRERFLYLQQDPSAIERKSSILPPKKPIIQHHHRAVGIDQGVQTDFIKENSKKHNNHSSDDNDDDDEHGEVDGDEEWFLQDSEWDEQEEVAMVEWLLGE